MKIHYVIAIHIWEDRPIFFISCSNDQLQNELEYTLLKPDCHSWWISKMQSGREEERYAIKFCFKLGKNAMPWKLDLCYDPETKRQSSQWKQAGSPRPKKARQSKSTHKLLMIPFFFDSTGIIYMQWVPTGQTVNKEYYVEVLREFRMSPSEEASTLKIGSVAFPAGQCTSLLLHSCHRLFDQDGHQNSSSASL